MIATFRADGRPATVRHLVGDGWHSMLRTIGWSLGLALAILLLTTPTSAKAADPDDGGSLLGGLTGGLGSILEPVRDIIEPVADPLLEPVADPLIEPVGDILEPVVDPLVEPIAEPVSGIVEPIVEPLVQPVSGIVTPVLEPVGDLIEPVGEQVVKPIVQPITAIAEPITAIVTPIGDLVPPVLEPIIQPVTGIVEPIVDEEPIADQLPQTSAPVAAPNLPPAGIDLPKFTLIEPFVQGDSAAAAPPPSINGRQATADNLAATTIDAGRAALRTPPATDPGSVAGLAADPGIATPWWTRLGQLGSLGSLGSGQTLNVFAFGIGAGLGFLMLLLLPPPFRVSRLHLAAVFWRPQRFVGPLVPPG